MAKTNEEKIQELEDLFNFIINYQDKFRSQIATDQEASDGDGRKGILMVLGPPKFVKVIEVRNGRLCMSNDVENTRTVILFKDLDSLIEVIQEFLNGNTSAISRSKARGDVRIEGEFAVRDFIVFNDIFAKIGEVLNAYGVTIAS
jgi:hypothetical protein